MPRNPKLRAPSLHPFHRPLVITDPPRPEDRKADEQQVVQSDDFGDVPAPTAQALRQVPAAELAKFLWRRQEPGLDQLPSSAGGRGRGQDSGIWRDQLLAEIEELARALKENVARYSSSRAGHSSGLAAEPANETAVVWIQDALEDIAATALGIEIASRKLFLQAASARDYGSNNETAREHSAGTGE